MISPLMASVANAALEAKLRVILRCDPFWKDHLHELAGARLKLILTDIGFKRVFQFGAHDLHLAPPFAEADVTLTTQSLHLLKLRDPNATTQAIADGHFYITGDQEAFDTIIAHLRCLDLDWETQLATFLPNGLAYQIRAMTDIAIDSLQHTQTTAQNSYRFWRDNEFHGKDAS